MECDTRFIIHEQPLNEPCKAQSVNRSRWPFTVQNTSFRDNKGVWFEGKIDFFTLDEPAGVT